MYSIRGHQQIVNEYHEECLRKARAMEAERVGDIRRGHGDGDAVPRAPEGTSLDRPPTP